MMAGKTVATTPKRLLRALAGETMKRPPWWLMRQAGRYLPEYRAFREKAGDFVTLCLTPALAAEVTLQPVRRFGMDAAILFSDILLVPRALGQRLSFENDGPKLGPLSEVDYLRPLDLAMLDSVGEAVARVHNALPDETTLIGFAGAPWTVATYMVEGGTSRDFRETKMLSYQNPKAFSVLIEAIGEATFAFLALQIEAGVEAVQLFDSWAGALSTEGFERWVITPTKLLVARLKRQFSQIPVIGFPRGAGLMYERYVIETGVDAVGLGTGVPLAYAQEKLQLKATLQGNLDPVLLRVGGEPMRQAVIELCQALGKGPYIFNLGHGVLPDTPPEHVAELARLLDG